MTEDQKQQGVEVCEDLLEWANNSDIFLKSTMKHGFTVMTSLQ